MGLTGFFISRVGEKGSPERTRADEVFNGVVKPTATKFQIEITRSDLDPTPGPVNSQIVRAIVECDVVVADLTGRNPNVNYELGIAHAFAKRLVILVDALEALSFDTQNERVIVIGDSGQITVTMADSAKLELEAALSAVLADGYQPENLVTAVASSQSLDRLAPSNPIAAELAALKEQVEKVDTRVGLVVRRLPRVNASEELRNLKSFVEFVAGEGGWIVPDELVDQLVTGKTTAAFDRWVYEQQAILVKNNEKWDVTEAKTTADSAGYGYSEEPF